MSAVIASAPVLGHRLNGHYKIVEPVTALNTPVARPVALLHQADWQIHRLKASEAATGLVTFDNLSAGPWLLVSRDPAGEYQAVALSDRLATPDGSRP